jgi:uncharacterized BrkB/YihY/UPF0761 family membrane protein
VTASGDPEQETSPPEPLGLTARGKARAKREAARAQRVLDDQRRRRPLVDLGVGVYERDKSMAGTVVSSALAFRLFAFFIPMTLFLVGLAGFFGSYITARATQDAGITGSLAESMNEALNQHSTTRWVALLTGFVGVASTGRTLTKALVSASCLAWRLPVSSKTPVRVIGAVVGMVVGLGLMAVLTNWARHRLGIGVMSVSYLGVFVVFTIGWIGLSMLLPRPVPDPGATLPGAMLIGAALVALQAISQLYLPGRFDRASELYGAVGVSIVVLGWFFFLGRGMVLAMVLNATIYERFGSVSQVFFALPVIRQLPRRVAWVRRVFGLDEPGSEESSAAE